MINVIVNGKEKTYFAHCYNCGSDMEYNYSDVDFVENEDKDYLNTNYIRCPICGKLIVVTLRTKEDFYKLNGDCAIGTFMA